MALLVVVVGRVAVVGLLSGVELVMVMEGGCSHLRSSSPACESDSAHTRLLARSLKTGQMCLR